MKDLIDRQVATEMVENWFFDFDDGRAPKEVLQEIPSAHIERITRRKDKWPCRIANGCPAEDWIEIITGTSIDEWDTQGSICKTCPFEQYINRLAEFEDEAEYMEDDRK